MIITYMNTYSVYGNNTYYAVDLTTKWHSTVQCVLVHSKNVSSLNVLKSIIGVTPFCLHIIMHTLS